MYFFLRLAIFSISPTSILTRDTTGNGSRNDCHRLLHLEAENVPEVGRQGDVLEADAAAEERCDLADAVTGNAATDACHEEAGLGMLGGKLDETVDGSPHVVETFHRGNGIATPLEAFALSPDGSETLHGIGCCTASMESGGVAAEDEDFVGLEGHDMVGGDATSDPAPSCCRCPEQSHSRRR